MSLERKESKNDKRSIQEYEMLLYARNSGLIFDERDEKRLCELEYEVSDYIKIKEESEGKNKYVFIPDIKIEKIKNKLIQKLLSIQYNRKKLIVLNAGIKKLIYELDRVPNDDNYVAYFDIKMAHTAITFKENQVLRIKKLKTSIERKEQQISRIESKNYYEELSEVVPEYEAEDDAREIEEFISLASSSIKRNLTFDEVISEALKINEKLSNTLNVVSSDLEVKIEREVKLRFKERMHLFKQKFKRIFESKFVEQIKDRAFAELLSKTNEIHRDYQILWNNEVIHNGKMVREFIEFDLEHLIRQSKSLGWIVRITDPPDPGSRDLEDWEVKLIEALSKARAKEENEDSDED